MWKLLVILIVIKLDPESIYLNNALTLKEEFHDLQCQRISVSLLKTSHTISPLPRYYLIVSIKLINTYSVDWLDRKPN